MSSERLEESEWLHATANLKSGERTRIPHDCGEGDTLLISKEGNECRAYCFRCGATGYKAEHESIDAKLKRIAAEGKADASVASSLDLPEPREYDTKTWPLDAKVWFCNMGISLRMIEK